MNVRCPHCHLCLELVHDDPLNDVTCPSCGSHFSFQGDETLSYVSSSSRKIAHFDLIDRLGMGHFGAVWKARDTELDRVVAIKIPRKGQLEPAEVELFLREARAAAQLKHPNIVSVHEVGRDGDSVYIVSDFVQGATLSDWMTKGIMGLRETATLCAKVATALHHAHEKGVIHRDLKPGNIMVDESGEPHVMDFGLAKREAGEITMTIDGKVLGTPAYMPPEQARGDAHYADRRADVYSLGVILYQMLTGELPFRGNSRMLLVQILQDEAPSPRKLVPGLPRDLETIALKCLEKEPQKRYATSEELAAELRCWLEGKPINARPSTAVERTVKWARRRPAISCLLAGIVLVTVIGFAAVFSQWRRAEVALVQARTETQRAKQAEQHLGLSLEDQKKARAEADERRAEAVAAKTEAEMKRAEAEEARKEAANHLRDSGRRGTLLAMERGRTLLEQPLPNSGEGLLWLGMSNVFSETPDPDLVRAGWMNMLLWLPAAHSIRHHLATEGHVNAIVFSPDGHTVAVASDAGGVRMWNAKSGELVWQWPQEVDKLMLVTTALAFRPDGKQLAVGLGNTEWQSRKDQGEAILLDAASGKLVGAAMKHPDSVNAVVFTQDCETLVTGCYDKKIRRFNANDGISNGEPILATGRVSALAISPDGTQIAVGRTEGQWYSPASEVIFIDVAKWKLLDLRLKHPAGMKSLAFHPHGKILATGGDDRTLRTWNLRDGTLLKTMTHTTGSVSGVAYSPDGRTLVSSGFDYNIRIWNANTGQALSHPLLQNGFVYATAFHPDGLHFATGGGHDAKIWDFASVRVPFETKQAIEGSIDKASFSYDGTAVVMRLTRKSANSDRNVTWIQAWDIEKGTALGPAVEEPSLGWGVVLRRDKKLMMAPCNASKVVKVWRVEDGKQVAELKHTKSTACCAFSNDAVGAMIITGGDDQVARLWDGETFEPIGAPLPNDHDVLSAAFHPDGKSVLTGTRSLFQITRFQLPSGKVMRTPSYVNGAVNDLVFSPDGKRFASCEWGTWNVRLYDTETGEPISRPLRHEHSVDRRIDFSPDGTLLATGCDDSFIRLWDVESSQRVGPRLPCDGSVRALFVKKDEDRLEIIALDQSKSLRRWRIPVLANPPPQQLRLWTFLITGNYFDRSWGIEMLNDLQRKSVSEALLKLGGPPVDLAPDKEQQGNWHRHIATTAEKEGDWFAASWHLSKWRQLEPGNELIVKRLLKVSLDSDNYLAAAKLNEEQARVTPDSLDPLFDAALAYVAGKDIESYHRLCGQLIDRWKKQEKMETAERLAWIFKFGEHSQSDLMLPISLVDKAIAATKIPSARFHNTRGSLLYRLGSFEESIKEIEKAAALREKGLPQDSFILAFANERLGRMEEADRFIRLAEEQILAMHLPPDGKPLVLPQPVRQEYAIFRDEWTKLRAKRTTK